MTATCPRSRVVTDGKYSKLNVARAVPGSGTILAIDRGYNDYVWFGQLTRDGVFFVTRMKTKRSTRRRGVTAGW